MKKLMKWIKDFFKSDIPTPVRRKTKIEIINETVQYYLSHPRAVTQNGSCGYDINGLYCAHSRCLTDKAREEIVLIDCNTIAAKAIIGRKGDEIHKEEYRGHDSIFWSYIQIFHDIAEHWEQTSSSTNKLTARGREYVSMLKTEYHDKG